MVEDGEHFVDHVLGELASAAQSQDLCALRGEHCAPGSRVGFAGGLLTGRRAQPLPRSQRPMLHPLTRQRHSTVRVGVREFLQRLPARHTSSLNERGPCQRIGAGVIGAHAQQPGEEGQGEPLQVQRAQHHAQGGQHQQVVVRDGLRNDEHSS